MKRNPPITFDIEVSPDLIIDRPVELGSELRESPVRERDIHYQPLLLLLHSLVHPRSYFALHQLLVGILVLTLN